LAAKVVAFAAGGWLTVNLSHPLRHLADLPVLTHCASLVFGPAQALHHS
jgi:hypothetical protein